MAKKEKETTVERSKMLNKLRKRSKGAFERIKKTEAKAGGRKIPGGLEDAIGQTTSAKLDADKNGDPYVYVYASVLEPKELAGVPCGKYYKLAEDQYNSAEANMETFFNDMKLIGFSELIESSEDESEAVDKILKVLEKEKVKFVFNTSTRANKNGEYKIFFQESELSDDDEEEEEVEEEEQEDEEEEEGGDEEEEEEEEEKPSKGRPAPKTANKKGASVPFKVDDKVTTTGDYFEDGNEYEGVVTEIDIKAKTCSVYFEADDDTQDVPWANLAVLTAKKATKKSSKKDEEEEVPFEVGDTVRTTGDYFEDGIIYEGTVLEMDDENATVEFEDETCSVPLENLELAK